MGQGRNEDDGGRGGKDYRRTERELAVRQLVWMLEDEGLDWTQEQLGEKLGMRGNDVGEIINHWSDRNNTPTRSVCRLIDLTYRFVAGGPPEPPPLHEYRPRPRRRKEAAYGQPPGLRTDELALIHQMLDRLDRLEAMMQVEQPRRAKAAESAVSVRPIPRVSLADAALAALPAGAGGGEHQVVAAADLADRWSPRLNVDTPAVVTGVRAAYLAGVARALANSYPADHPLTLVTRLEAAVPQRTALTLDRLAVAAVEGEAAVHVPAVVHAGAVTSLEDVMATLLSPGGCPWDREQTHASLRKYLLEETYEVLAALDAGDVDKLPEELGDLLLQVVFHAQIASRDGEFQMADVVRGITSKLIRRHPHVFGAVSVADADEVTRNWERLKAEERAQAGQQAADPFAGISLALPALSRAQELQRRATRFGFQWPDREAAWAKFEAELAEWHAAATEEERAREFGDAVFALASVAQVEDLDAESALREANNRFTTRFTRLLAECEAAGLDPHDLPATELLRRWGHEGRLETGD